jgi:hypothetical protein
MPKKNQSSTLAKSSNTSTLVNTSKIAKSSNIAKSSESYNSDMDFLDKCIEENKLLMEQQTEKITLSPLEQNLNNAKKEEIKTKMRNPIYMKQQIRCTPSKREIQTQQDLLNQMMKHPKMTNEILQFYGKAIEYMPAKILPTPIEIFDNVDKYKKLYYNYIMQLLQTIKANNQSIEQLDNY